MEELLDERFPEVLFDSFGLEHQAVVQLAQLLHEAVWRRRRPEVFTAEVLRETWRTTHKRQEATVPSLARKSNGLLEFLCLKQRTFKPTVFAGHYF